MIVEQMVEIPANHRVYIDVPPQIPAGRAKAVLTLTFETPGQMGDAWVNPLKGICRGSKMTLERFREKQREDKALEDALD